MTLLRISWLFLLLGLPFYGMRDSYAAGTAAKAFSPPHAVATAPAVASQTPLANAPERTLYTVTLTDAEKMVGDALIAGGAGARVQVTLYGEKKHPLTQSAAPVKTDVSDLHFDTTSGRISATLSFQGLNLPPVHVQGRYDEIVDVPALVKTVDSGLLIGKDDIVMIQTPVHRLRKDTVMKAENIVGKSPKRAIGPNRPVREEELANASDIKKGALVTLQYRTGAMQINTTGEALEPGSVGSHIHVKNSSSNVVVSGTLESNNIVAVSPLSTP